MSLHIQTDTGLLEIGGSVTKEKIIEALGYVPADSNNLLDNIVEDESGNLTIADQSGNVIMTVGENGVHTTEVIAYGIEVGKTIVEHITDPSVHVTSEEKSTWDNKSDFSGFYADLPDAPNIAEDNSGEVVYADEYGNVILKINENGLETTQVTADNIILNGENVTTKIDTLNETISSHADDADKHVSDKDRISWNEKASIDYVDEKVASIVNSAPEALDTLNELAVALGNDENFATTVTNSLAEKASKTDLDVLKNELSESIVSEKSEWIVADNDGNIIAKVDNNGLETTTVTAQAVIVNSVDIEIALDNKSDIKHTHSISDIENLEDNFDAKADKVYIDELKAKYDEMYENKNIFDGIYLRDIENGNLYLVQMKGGTLVSSSKTVSIQISKEPDKMVYENGEVFDPTGMIVSTTCEDGTQKIMSNYTYSDIVDGVVTITYNEAGIEYTTTLNVSIKSLEDELIDFEYTKNEDGTYTLNGWKGTLNGVTSTEMVFPDSDKIIM